MKYILLLVGVVVIYYFLGRSAPIAPVTKAMAGQEVAPLTTGSRETAAPADHSLKRPIDRTNEVLGQVKQRNGAGEF